MKIIWTDGLARDHIADRLVAENIASKEEGKIMVEALQSNIKSESDWYLLVPDDQRLSRGMEDLV